MYELQQEENINRNKKFLQSLGLESLQQQQSFLPKNKTQVFLPHIQKFLTNFAIDKYMVNGEW